MTKHIPNFLTLCNLACGCYGVVMVFRGELEFGAIMVLAGAMFDFLDGMTARMLNRFSLIGKDLDSLADLITFCFLPGSILYVLIEQDSANTWLPLTGFLLVIFGALRLAKFNNDTRQTEIFYGLPVPASGIFVSGIPFLSGAGSTGFYAYIANSYALVGIAILLSLLMISNVRLMSLKFKSFSLQGNWARYILIVFSLILVLTLKLVALPLIIILYVVLSVALNFTE